MAQVSMTFRTSGGYTEDLEGTVTLEIRPSAAVTRAEFYVDGVLVATVASAPYDYAWDTTTVENGGHHLEGKVFYRRVNMLESELGVSVLNPLIPEGDEEIVVLEIPELIE